MDTLIEDILKCGYSLHSHFEFVSVEAGDSHFLNCILQVSVEGFGELQLTFLETTHLSVCKMGGKQ